MSCSSLFVQHCYIDVEIVRTVVDGDVTPAKLAQQLNAGAPRNFRSPAKRHFFALVESNGDVNQSITFAELEIAESLSWDGKRHV